MERLVSGAQDHYYGKADVTVYRLIRDNSCPVDQCPVERFLEQLGGGSAVDPRPPARELEAECGTRELFP